MLIPVCFSELCTEESLFDERRGFYKVLFSPEKRDNSQRKTSVGSDFDAL